MLKDEWKQLKSGTDIRGVAMEGVEGQPVQLTDEVVERIIASFAAWLSDKTGKPCRDLTVSIGRDSRLVRVPVILRAATAALSVSGIRVLDCALASTPAMFMTTVDLGCNAAVQITASHHPWHRNRAEIFPACRRTGGQRHRGNPGLVPRTDDGPPATVQGLPAGWKTPTICGSMRPVCAT